MADNNRTITYSLTGNMSGLISEIRSITTALEGSQQAAQQLGAMLSQLHTGGAGGSGSRGGSTGGSAGGAAAGMNQYVDATMRAERASEAIAQKVANASAQMNQMGHQAGRTSSAVGGLASELGNFAKGILIYKALETITDGLREVAEEENRAIESAGKLDVLRRSYANLFGGVAAGDEQLSLVSKAADDTSTSIENTAHQTERLLAAGMSLDRAIPTIKALSAVLRGTGGSQEDLNGALLAFAQIQEKGVAQSEEIRRQLTNRMVPALFLYAQASHKTMAQATQDMQDGKISASEFFQYFTQGAMQNYGTMLDPVNRSLADVEQHLQNAQFLAEAAFGRAPMLARKQATLDWAETLERPETINALQKMGAFAALFEQALNRTKIVAMEIAGVLAKPGGYFDFAWRQIVSVSEVLGNKIPEQFKDLNTVSALFEKGGAAAGAYGDGIVGVGEATDQATDSAEAYKKALDDQIAALQRTNDLLQREKTLRDDLMGLDKTTADLAKAQRFKFDFYSDVGRRNRESIPDLEQKLANQQYDLTYDMRRIANQEQIYQLGLAKAAGPPTTVGSRPFAGSDIYNAGRVPGAEGAIIDSWGRTVVTDPARRAVPIPGSTYGSIYSSYNSSMQSVFDRMSGAGAASGNSFVAGICTNCGTTFMIDQLANNPQVGRAASVGVRKAK